jgi:hypothetical protein
MAALPMRKAVRSWISATEAAISAAILLAPAANNSPSAVSRTCLVLRSNNRAPTSFSSLAIIWLKADGDT